jgi:hypothetical protein
VRRVVLPLLLATLAACRSDRPTEFVDVAFAPNVPVEHYRAWDFDHDRIRDLDDPRVDVDFVRAELLAAIEDELEELGFERVPGGPVDFRVHYELWVAGPGDLDGVRERLRGRIFVFDERTGRFVWRGERKAPVGDDGYDEERARERIRLFVRELLRYTRKLEDPEDPDDLEDLEAAAAAH